MDFNIEIIFFIGKLILMEDVLFWYLVLNFVFLKGNDLDDLDGEVLSWDKFLFERFFLMGRGLFFVFVICKFVGGLFIVLFFNFFFKRVFFLFKFVFIRFSIFFCGLFDGEGRG